MAQTIGDTGGMAGTADPLDGQYSVQSDEEFPLRTQLHFRTIEAIAREIREGGLNEVGGLLLGHANPDEANTAVRIDSHRPIECHHRAGPEFILDEEEHVALDAVARDLLQTGELSVVGFYHRQLSGNPQVEEADREIVSRYFGDPSDVLLLIAGAGTDLSGRFFARSAAGQILAAGPAFPFRGPDTHPGPPASPPRERARLIPDFDSAPAPARTIAENIAPALPLLPPLPPPRFSVADDMEDQPGPLAAWLRRWWPLLGALALAGGGLWFLLQSSPNPRDQAASSAGAADPAASIRPLGLYVDGSGPTWRISWNPSATALQGAQSVRLFVREGEDQTRPELSPQDLASGTYQYQPRTQDVIFRLEVMDNGGRMAAESFRLVKDAPAALAKPPVPKAPAARGQEEAARGQEEAVPETASGAREIVQPKATHKVPPVVPASIRPRIKGSIPIDIRVRVDARGRVTSATPVTKPRSGLQTFLTKRAVSAAELWRFDPAKRNGKAVPGGETIHFVFER